MTKHNQSGFAQTVITQAIRGWFRRDEDSPADNDVAMNRAALRAADLASIAAFLERYDLPVSSDTLAAAHAIAAGRSEVLAQAIEERVAAGLPVTAHWLALRSGSRADAGAVLEDAAVAQVDELVRTLRSMIENFSTSTAKVRKETGDYGKALEGHAADIAQADAAGIDLDPITGLVRRMIDRTRRAEADMRRSEEEAASLRASLAAAQKDADIDALTGLPNRRAFEGEYRKLYAVTREAVERLSVAFCDIDHFKRINDSHGHETGDRMLCAVATALSAISGEKCHLSRHGGEEFVMLFRGATASEAAERLDALREAMARRNFVNRHTDEPIGTVTFSAGVADVFAYSDPREALRAADMALYRAKELGRNRIEVAGDD